MASICALIAAYDEAAHVGAVVRGTRPYVAEVVVVDDGSADETAEAAREAGAVVLRHDTNRGKGHAIRTGLAYCLAGPWTYVLLLDADLQHDPGEIPKLIAAAGAGAGEFVLGEREFQKHTMPAARYHANVIGSRILSWFIGAPVVDSQSGFRLIRSDRLRGVRLTASGYEIETEMLIKLARAGARIDRVSVSRLRYEGTRSKMRPVRDTFRTCMLALRYRYLTVRDAH